MSIKKKNKRVEAILNTIEIKENNFLFLICVSVILLSVLFLSIHYTESFLLAIAIGLLFFISLLFIKSRSIIIDLDRGNVKIRDKLILNRNKIHEFDRSQIKNVLLYTFSANRDLNSENDIQTDPVCLSLLTDDNQEILLYEVDGIKYPYVSKEYLNKAQKIANILLAELIVDIKKKDDGNHNNLEKNIAVQSLDYKAKIEKQIAGFTSLRFTIKKRI